MNDIARHNRKESYDLSKPEFSEQEQIVMDHLAMGVNHAWLISKRTGLLITSVRRCLTNLYDKGEGVIKETGTVFNDDTKRNVTTYAIKDRSVITDIGQGSLFEWN